ncbi:MAG TPA: cytochrome c [Thermohalobaculum sp.]|nr:cytochrome c [Thermohalobaculum sp.]
MKTSRSQKMLSAVVLCSAVLLAPTIAATQDTPDAGQKVIEARQGYMKLVSWEAGPLFGMAKGEVAYDAATATANAADLKALSQYAFPGLFLAGTSKTDRAGKTRAMSDIWEDMAKFEMAFGDLGAAINLVAAEAGKGQTELAAAVGELGKACGGCHKPFRAKDF